MYRKIIREVNVMYLVAIDLDGTLFNSQDTISLKNLQAIENLERRGIEVTLATGRDYKAVKAICEEAGINPHIICSNGTAAYTKDGRRIFSVALDLKVVKTMLNWLEAEKYYYEVTANNTTYASIYARQYLQNEFDTASSSANEHNIKEYQLELGKLLRPISVVTHPEELYADDKEYQNILVFCPDLKRLAAGAAFFKAMPELSVVSSLTHNIEMVARNASKGAALKALADERGITLANTIAIGDNYNDVSMFKAAGYSIAMGNAHESIKNICTHVTLTNDEDGVAHALQYYVPQIISEKKAAYGAYMRIQSSYTG